MLTPSTAPAPTATQTRFLTVPNSVATPRAPRPHPLFFAPGQRLGRGRLQRGGGGRYRGAGADALTVADGGGEAVGASDALGAVVVSLEAVAVGVGSGVLVPSAGAAGAAVP